MGKCLLGVCGSSALQATGYLALGGSIASNATEANRKLKIPTAGVISNLGVYVNGAGTGRTLKSRINVAGVGNLNVPITDSVAGPYFDDVNTDSISAATFLDFIETNPSTATTYRWVAFAYQANSGHVGLYATGKSGSATNGAAGDNFLPLSGFCAVNATEARAQTEVRVAGSFDYIGLNLLANTYNQIVAVTSRKNGANGGIAFNISAAAGAGHFESSGGSDSLVSGDLVCLDFNMPAGSGVFIVNHSICEITAAGGVAASDHFMVGGNANTRNAGWGTTHYLAPVGQMENFTNTSEAEVRIRPGFACTIKNFRLKPSVNTYTTNGTVVLRKNGVDKITLTIPNTGAVTLIEDAISTLEMSASDDFSISIVGGTSGNLTVDYFAYTVDTAKLVAWMIHPEKFIAPYVANVEQSPAFAPHPITATPGTGLNMGWFAPPDRFRSPAVWRYDLPPSFMTKPPVAGSGFFARYYYDLIAGRAH